MQRMISFVKNKYGIVAILLVAVLSVGFLTPQNRAQSANCPQLAPTHPQFDVFPINYDPSTICTDAAQIDAFTIGAAGRDGRFAQSQTEHDAGVTANPGDEVWVSVYFHNGASDQVDRTLTTAHNTVIAVNLNGGTSTDHAISSQISASNAATVPSANRGGSAVVHTSQASTLSYIPGSSSICITLQHATERVGAAAAQALPNCGVANKELAIGDGVASGGFNLGDLKACFPYSGTLDFKVKVNANAAPGQGKLSIAKSVKNQTSGQTTFANSTSARQGDIVNYQVVVTDTGTANVNNVTVNDPGASGITPASGTIFPNNASLGTLVPGQSKTLNYSAQITASSGTIVNTATASGTGVASVSDTATVTVNTPAPQVGSLSITKQVKNLTTGQTFFGNSTTARQNDTVSYQIVVTDTGSGNVDNVVVNDPGVGGISGNFPSNASLGTLTPGQSRTLTFDATVTASSGTLTNTATASGNNVASVSASASVTVNTPAPQVGNLSITKQVQNLTTGSGLSNSTTARQGDTVQYQIVVTDTGSGNVNNVVVNDPGASGVSGNFPSNFGVGTLTPGQSRNLTFTATVTASSGTVVNTATASGTGVASVSASASVIINTPIQQNSSMSITKGVTDFTRGNTGFAPSVNAFIGDTVGFQIILTNTGNTTLNNVNITDNMPFGMNLVPGSLAVSTGINTFNNVSLNNIFISSLGQGQQVIVSFSAVINQTGTMTNTVTATANNANTVSAQATVFVQANPVNPGNLVVTKLVKNETQGNAFFSKSVTANPGDRIAFQISVGAQNADANNVFVIDSLPQFFNFISGSARLNSNSMSDNLVQGGSNIGTVSQGQTVTIFLEGTVSNNIPVGQQVLTNNVSVSAQNAPTVTDSASVIVNQNAQAFSQLSINKLVRNISFQNILQKNVSAFPNDRVGFQISVTNTGTATINNVTVHDSLPSGFTLAGGTTRLDGNVVSDINNSSLFLGSMTPGQQHTITFEGNVNAPVNSTIQNTAFAQGDNAVQVQDTASVVINNPVQGANINLIQSKRAFNDTRNADATLVTAQKEDFITYTLTVANSGNAPANNFVISDDLSGVLSLASLVNNGGGTLNGNVISWPAVTIPAGGSVTETFRVRVNFFLPTNSNLVLTNTFGNTVVVHIGQVLGQTFVPPKTGSSMEVALGFGAMITAAFAVMRKRFFALIPKFKIR